MLGLPETVRSIRARLGETMATFAARLDLRHNTISQYEAGKARPSPGVLIKLYELAGNAEERESLRNALGPQTAELLLSSERTLQKSIEEANRRLDQARLELQTSPSARQRMVDLTCEILRLPEVPLWLLDLMDQWLSVAHEPAERAFFEEIVNAYRLKYRRRKARIETLEAIAPQ
jgi:transcriptional regulator with XRE-family HTH domain